MQKHSKFQCKSGLNSRNEGKRNFKTLKTRMNKVTWIFSIFLYSCRLNDNHSPSSIYSWLFILELKIKLLKQLHSVNATSTTIYLTIFLSGKKFNYTQFSKKKHIKKCSPGMEIKIKTFAIKIFQFFLYLYTIFSYYFFSCFSSC